MNLLLESVVNMGIMWCGYKITRLNFFHFPVNLAKANSVWYWLVLPPPFTVTISRLFGRRTFMVMRVYLILKFSSGLKGLKRDGKRSETISVPVVPAHQKQTLTLKKSVKLFDTIIA
jgi:hypothetical protein